MIDWGKCIKGETVFVDEFGEERLFIAEYEDRVWYKFSGNYVHYTDAGKSRFKNAYIKGAPVDLSKLIKRRSVLKPSSSNAYRYTFLWEECGCLIVANASDHIMKYIPPTEWKKWVVERYE